MSKVPSALVIVEAEPSGARSLQALLARSGAEVRAVASVAAALTEVDRKPCDAVILDAEALGGASLPEVIRGFRDVPVVVAGAGGAKRAVEAMRAGAADFVEKPFEEAELTYVLDKIPRRCTTCSIWCGALPAARRRC